MIQRLNYKELDHILTKREIETINKRLQGMNLSQQDSNYLSRFVRPRLRQMKELDAKKILDLLSYRQKKHAIEKKIINILLMQLNGIKAIILFGSVIHNNYNDYRDIDCIVIVKKPFWEKLPEKYRKINEIRNIFRKNNVDIDLQIYDRITFNDSKNSNLSLIYQLKDSKVIYGKIILPEKYSINKLDLRIKLDYSIFEENDYNSLEGKEIYWAIRNIILIKLLANGIIDNQKLNDCTINEIGKNLAIKLKNNLQNKIEKKIAILMLKNLTKLVYEELKRIKWEKIKLSNH